MIYLSSGLVVYTVVPLGACGICGAYPSDCVAHQSLNLAPYFAAFYCFLQKGPFPGLHWSSSPSGFMRIPIQCLFFSGFNPLPQSLSDQWPFLILICSNTGFCPASSHSSVLLPYSSYNITSRSSYACYSSQISIYKSL